MPARTLQVKFWQLLFDVDTCIAQAVQAARCPHCNGPLHRADYPRKPRGGPLDPDIEQSLLSTRISFCCGRPGCRRRSTPPSVRFLGPKVYLGAAILLAGQLFLSQATVAQQPCAIPPTQQAPATSLQAPPRTVPKAPQPPLSKASQSANALLLPTAQTLGGNPAQARNPPDPALYVPLPTLRRWQRWWRTDFVKSHLYQTHRDRFIPPLDIQTLPRSLLLRFTRTRQSLEQTLVRTLRFLAPLTTTSVHDGARFLRAG
jgi:hypothetical protein